MQTNPAFILKTIAGQALDTLTHLLRTAQKHAAEHEIDEQALLQMRFYPDMQTLLWNAQMISEFAVRTSLRLSGATGDAIPSIPYEETDFGELIARVEQALGAIREIPDNALDNCAATIEMPFGPDQVINLKDSDFLLRMMVPNLHFHVTVVYTLLRSNGVPLGKMDYLGSINPA